MKIGDKVKFKNKAFEGDNAIFNGKEAEVIDFDMDGNSYTLKCDDEKLKVTSTVLMTHTEKEYQPKHAKETNVVAELFHLMNKTGESVSHPLQDKVQKHKELCEKLNNIYKQKNEKYGDSFGISVKKYGLISALTRISDKFNRFEQLVLEGSNGTDDETLLDTCLDTANYFIMTAIELEEKQ